MRNNGQQLRTLDTAFFSLRPRLCARQDVQRLFLATGCARTGCARTARSGALGTSTSSITSSPKKITFFHISGEWILTNPRKKSQIYSQKRCKMIFSVADPNRINKFLCKDS
jgi:hypothetical protein